MKNECPHCGESYSALKNHIRLASGNGHGSSGSYPEDKESSEPTKGSNREEKSIDITAEELETRLTEASDRAYEVGREDERREQTLNRKESTRKESDSETEAEAATLAQKSSQGSSRGWLAAAGGLAALALLKEGGDEHNLGHRRRRM